MKTVLITGGSGLVGQALSHFLSQQGYSVISLGRSQVTVKNRIPGVSYALWNPALKTMDKEAFMKADYVVHLAGAAVMDRKWTDAYKKEIVDSRVESGKFLSACLLNIPNKVRAIIGASAIGYYGEDRIPAKTFIETDPSVKNFLGETCKQWEESLYPVMTDGKRLVTIRIGIVLSREGGAFPELARSLKWGMAAWLGKGSQLVSWIHIEDLCRMILFAMENESIKEVYNAVAPVPVSNRELVLEIAKQKKRPFFSFRVPSFILQWMLGERSLEILKSTSVSSDKILAGGFIFNYPLIGKAVESLI